MLLDVMEHISKDEKYALMERASSSFLNTMFVMRKEDIKDYFEDWSQDRFEKYNCFGIILTDDMLQQYIEKWFKGLIKTVSTQIFMQHNRLLTCVTFRTALQSFMKQLSPEDVALCIQTVSANFRNTMFVIREHDAQVYCMRNYLLGIVIPDSLLQQYIERIFDDFTKSDELRAT
ncbi:unnamed protein product [Mytilus edulis]|uniref:Uncharacterized protein n=1 Tax=Mytilus edulis TaxID=6550 RepID=A0A8S3QVA5_MYTED|nr:unnamed protein product [Mytilus edulis]